MTRPPICEQLRSGSELRALQPTAAPLTLLRPGGNRARRKGQFSCGTRPGEKAASLPPGMFRVKFRDGGAISELDAAPGTETGGAGGTETGEQEGMHESIDAPLQKQTAVTTKGTKGSDL